MNGFLTRNAEDILDPLVLQTLDEESGRRRLGVYCHRFSLLLLRHEYTNHKDGRTTSLRLQYSPLHSMQNPCCARIRARRCVQTRGSNQTFQPEQSEGNRARTQGDCSSSLAVGGSY